MPQDVHPTANALKQHSIWQDGQQPEPCIIVIFGATGDLTQRKLLPTLAHLLLNVTCSLIDLSLQLVFMSPGIKVFVLIAHTYLFSFLELCLLHCSDHLSTPEREMVRTM